MKVSTWLTTLFATAVLAFIGSACGQLDGNGRSVVYDVRDAGTETVVLVVHTDLALPEKVAVDLTRMIRIVDDKAPFMNEDLRNQLDPNGPILVELQPNVAGYMPVIHPESRADYEAFRELVRMYPQLEIIALDFSPDAMF